MAYDEDHLARIRDILADKSVKFTEKQMFGASVFMMHEKLLCGTRIDKKTGENMTLCRIGEEEFEKAIERDDCVPMGSGHRTMPGYVYVTEDGTKKKRDLERWIQLCLDFNPLAKKSKS